MKDVERRVETEGLLDHPSYDGDSCCPYLLVLISKGDIDGKMDVEPHTMRKGKVNQTADLTIVGDAVLPAALKKDQFDFIEKRTQPDDIGDDLVRIDVGGRGELKWKSSPIIFEHQ
jgi:hypothetical protein